MKKIIFGLAPALALMSGTAAAAAPAWKVSEVSGQVRLTENGKSRQAARGALLSSGSMITTGPSARAVIVRGEEFVVISPSTQLRVPAVATQNRVFQLIEDFGTAVFKIKKKSTPHFGVQTPYLAAVVKGTTFTVTVGEEGSTVQVTEGAVEVSTLDGGAADIVRPGAIAMVGASDLYRLSIEGETNKALVSSKAPLVGGLSIKSQRPSYAGPKAKVVKLSAPVREDGKELGETTKGLVHGRSGDRADKDFHGQNRDAKREKAGKGPKPDGDDDDKGGGNDKPDKPDKDKPTDPKDKPTDPKDKPTDPSDEPKDKPSDPPGDPKDPPSDPGDEPEDKPNGPGDEPRDDPRDEPKDKPKDPRDEPKDPRDEPKDKPVDDDVDEDDEDEDDDDDEDGDD